MKGSEGIASLKLENLNKLISKFPKAPSMTFSNMFPTAPYPSDTIRWEVEYGSAGMTPSTRRAWTAWRPKACGSRTPIPRVRCATHPGMV